LRLEGAIRRGEAPVFGAQRPCDSKRLGVDLKEKGVPREVAGREVLDRQKYRRTPSQICRHRIERGTRSPDIVGHVDASH